MGLYILALMLIWFGVLCWAAKGITRGGDTRYRMIISTIIIVLVYPLPVADEIIGAIQFKILCKQQVIYKDPDMESKKGAHLKVVIQERKRISDKAVPMTSTIFEYIEPIAKRFFRTGRHQESTIFHRFFVISEEI
ncbi:hypothetical protein [Massilia genomosp. 1]|uniref:Uncharacterized protein n=1 Tax=Massilia genomosp. 1 TaxID=2609280 RepID=A0ABX0MWP8_9BURK|nr:hypothetical protein [Massilia genomosp. 1]NHZ67184.1 hypothetical protein [Massilia genomosp. 1]